MRNSTKKPISVKIRKSFNSEKVAILSEKYVDAICIHPRTAEQGYSGEPDLEFAKKIKSLVKIPVIYSGNVNERNYKELLKIFDFVEIGRTAIGNPSIFSKVTGKNTKFNFFDYLKIAEKYNITFNQMKYQAMNFTKGQKNAVSLRREISHSTSLEEIKTAIKKTI
jgi:tRNA-dihydrouridine synthase